MPENEEVEHKIEICNQIKANRKFLKMKMETLDWIDPRYCLTKNVRYINENT